MTKPDIVYICKGEGAECYLQPGCIYREDPKSESDWVCNHTTKPENAKYGPCAHPEDPNARLLCDTKFIFYEIPEECGPSYYWEVEEDDECGTSD